MSNWSANYEIAIIQYIYINISDANVIKATQYIIFQRLM